MFWCTRAATKQLVATRSTYLVAATRTFASSSSKPPGGKKGGNNNNNNNNNGEDTTDNTTTETPVMGGGGGSTEHIKRLLQQFDQKLQQSATPANMPKRTEAQETQEAAEEDDENLDEEYMTEEERVVDANMHIFEELLEHEAKTDIPYLFDPKMIREHNKYIEKAAWANKIDLQARMETIDDMLDEDDLEELKSEEHAKFVKEYKADLRDEAMAEAFKEEGAEDDEEQEEDEEYDSENIKRPPPMSFKPVENPRTIEDEKELARIMASKDKAEKLDLFITRRIKRMLIESQLNLEEIMNEEEKPLTPEEEEFAKQLEERAERGEDVYDDEADEEEGIHVTAEEIAEAKAEYMEIAALQTGHIPENLTDRQLEFIKWRREVRATGETGYDFEDLDDLEEGELSDHQFVVAVEMLAREEDNAYYVDEYDDIPDNIAEDLIEKHEEDEEAEEEGALKEEVSEDYIHAQRDFYRLPMEIEGLQATPNALATTNAAATKPTDAELANTLYDDDNLGDEFFLAPAEEEMDDEALKELSDEIDKEPLFEYDMNDRAQLELEAGIREDLEVAAKRGKSAPGEDIMDIPENMYEMDEDEMISKLDLASLEKTFGEDLPENDYNENGEESQETLSMIRILNEKDGYLEEELDDNDNDNEEDDEDEDGTDPDLMLAEEDMDDSVMDYVEEDETVHLKSLEGLSQLTDFADAVEETDLTWNTDFDDDLRIMTLEADMYIRRKLPKLKVLEKRRENAKKHQATQLAKIAANPTPAKPYQRATIPVGADILTTPLKPESFVRVAPITKDEVVSPAHKDAYNTVLKESHRVLSGNAFYSNNDTRNSLKHIRAALAAFKPHVTTRRQQMQTAKGTKDPRFEKYKNIIVEPWQLPKENPDYYSFDDAKDLEDSQ
eukprot:gene15619-18559_t